MNCDILIVGGGASGLSAAVSAKRSAPALSVMIAERLPKVGKKLLATGGGRCNFSNSGISAANYRGSCLRILERTAEQDIVAFFASLGVPGANEDGRIYPRSFSAAGVLDALRLECEKLGADILCDHRVRDIKREGDCFIVEAGNDRITAKRVIVCGGGCSQPALGSDGSAFELCRGLGLKVNEPYPALVPLKTKKELVAPLKGIRARAAVSFLSRNTVRETRSGEVQFTEDCVSGICVFELSYLAYVFRAAAELSVDLMPEYGIEELREFLKELAEIRSHASAEDLLSGVMNKRLGSYIIKSITKKPLSACVSELSEKELSMTAKKIKDLRFPVIGTAGFERSQVTGGGVDGKCVGDGLEAVSVPGLYICGETLDLIGDCGGFNLDFAFSAGIIAGRSAAGSLVRLPDEKR